MDGQAFRAIELKEPIHSPTENSQQKVSSFQRIKREMGVKRITTKRGGPLKYERSIKVSEFPERTSKFDIQ